MQYSNDLLYLCTPNSTCFTRSDYLSNLCLLIRTLLKYVDHNPVKFKVYRSALNKMYSYYQTAKWLSILLLTSVLRPPFNWFISLSFSIIPRSWWINLIYRHPGRGPNLGWACSPILFVVKCLSMQYLICLICTSTNKIFLN